MKIVSTLVSISVLLLGQVVSNGIASQENAPQENTPKAKKQVTLLGTLEHWRYPDSVVSGASMFDGNTVNSKGDRTVVSIGCKAVLKTDAAVAEVVAYYKKKLQPTAKANDEGQKQANDDVRLEPSGSSVTFSDYSEGRLVDLHTINVITKDQSTTLVITRGKDETKTHISWNHYKRF